MRRCGTWQGITIPCVPRLAWRDFAQQRGSRTKREQTLTMSNDDKLIDFSAERGKRIHDLHDKKLDEMRQAFEQALPLPKVKKKAKSKPKKR
jgi:hypothetical protein